MKKTYLLSKTERKTAKLRQAKSIFMSHRGNSSGSVLRKPEEHNVK